MVKSGSGRICFTNPAPDGFALQIRLRLDFPHANPVQP